MSDKQDLIQLYGIYVQTISANEQRRQTLSALYLSLVAAGIALLGSDKEIQHLAIAIPIAVISLVWFSTIRYFRNLAKAKFKVISEFEDNFEVKPFFREWEFYKKEKGGFKIGLTHLELIVPIIIFVVSMTYIVYDIFWYMISKY